VIRTCGPEDAEEIHVIINEAARAYKGVIPPDRYHEPYMPMDELREEMQCMTFFGWEENRRLVGVSAMPMCYLTSSDRVLETSSWIT